MQNISVVIPSFNNGKFLRSCLESVRDQNYDQEKIEILVIDGGSKDKTKEICKKYKVNFILENNGSPETAKGIGVKRARGKIILFLDCDNIIPYKNWLREMVSYFEKENNIVGIYTWRYAYRKTDKILNRYFELFGVNDIVAWFLGKADRQSYLTDKWNLYGDAEDKGEYYVVKFEKEKVPTLGANGFLIKRELLNKVFKKTNNFYHIDVNYDLIKNGFNRYIVVKNDVVHLSGESVIGFFKRRKRYMNELYLRDYGKRSYFLYNPQKDLLKVILFCFYSISIVFPLFDSIVGYFRKKDLAWFLHPIMCLGMCWIYGEVLLRKSLLKK